MDKEKEYKFIGKAVRCIYDTENFRIYAFDVDKNKYPNIKHSKYKDVVVMGELPVLSLNTEYTITATPKESQYGTSYKVINIKREKPTTTNEVYIFLSEFLTENQTSVLMKHYPDIIDRVRENRLDDIDLNKLKGIKEYTFNVIKNKIVENFCLLDLVVEFNGYLSLSIIRKIYNKYSSIEILKQKLKADPYKCLCGLAGVGFKTADSILLDIEKASKENIKNGKEPIVKFDCDLRTSPQRCLACILYLLSENENEGNTKMNLADLRSQCLKTTPACADHFVGVIKSDEIYYSKETMNVALKNTYETEKYIANAVLNNINNKNNVWDFDAKKYQKVNGVILSDEQIQIVNLVCQNQISILNGASGCGKSCSTQAIINMLIDNQKSFKIFAPTGKAAKVISNFTGQKASTIHRGLEYSPTNIKEIKFVDENGREQTEYTCWGYNRQDKLFCDIVIIDEFSMVDLNLFKKVIDAIDFTKTKLLMIGDNAQLPSVGCGNLLHDFMKSKIIPTVTLTKVFRYSEGGLMKVATDVRCSKTYLDNTMKSKATVFGDNQDYVFIDLDSEAIPKNAVALYKKLLDKGNTIENIQVLTAKNVSECGTNVLNNMLQRIANPNYNSVTNIKVGDTTYYIGDLIIQKQNNYKAKLDCNHLLNNMEAVDSKQIEFDLETQLLSDSIKDEESPTVFVANGETGIIKDIYDMTVIIDFDGIYVKYKKEDMNMVGLGYAITIHKSQGSSIDNVILCTPQSHIFMLNNNLLYTGLTRMKKKCYHLGTLKSVNQAISKKANLERNTFMQHLLKQTATKK